MADQKLPQPAKKITVANYLKLPQTQGFLDSMLSEKKSEFCSNLIALTDSDANLAACDPGQLIKCAMNATSVNLSLNKNLGHAYVIAYKDRSGKSIPQFQIGFKGLIQLAIRSGQYELLNAVEIREGEMTRNKFTTELTFHGEYPENKIIGYLAFLKLKNGFTHSIYMTEAQMEEHAMRFSKSYQYDKSRGKKTSKWSDPDARLAMSLKTVIKALLGKYGVLSTEMQNAMANDNDHEENSGGARTENAEAEIIKQDDPAGQNAETVNAEIVEQKEKEEPEQLNL